MFSLLSKQKKAGGEKDKVAKTKSAHGHEHGAWGSCSPGGGWDDGVKGSDEAAEVVVGAAEVAAEVVVVEEGMELLSLLLEFS
ncbi:hypothetical protein RUND412_007164 [Rhizina undulata]